MTDLDLDLREIRLWLLQKKNQLSQASTLFKGGQISPSILDPLRTKFPREWDCYLLKYQPGVGVVPGAINAKHIRLECACSKKAVA